MSAARLKLMLFSHICSSAHITGAEKLLLFFASELRSNHDCMLVVPNEGLLSTEARARQIPTIVVPYPNFYEMYAPGPYFKEALEGFIQEGRESLGSLLHLLHEYRPDLVINNTCVNVLPVRAARALGIPVAWMITEQIQTTRYTSMSVDLIVESSDWIVGISDATLQPFRGGAAESKIRILYPSWNEPELERGLWPYYRSEKRAEIGWDESLRIIGYVSSDIYPNKGLEHFIQMAIEVGASYPYTRFMVAGKPTDTAYYNKCLQLIKAAGLGSRFYMHPFEMQIQKIYPSMDVVVIPSLIEEGFGMTALEGLIFGKTVITYSAGGLNEVLLQTGNGSYLVEKGSVKGLINTVTTLLNKGDYMFGWGARNSTAAQDAFGIDSYRLRMADWLHQAATSLPQPGPALLPQEVLNKYPPLFAKGLGPAVFLLERGFKYLFTGEEVFFQWGGSFDKVVNQHDAYLLKIPEGPEIRGGQLPPPPAPPPPGAAVRRRARGKKRRLKKWRKPGQRIKVKKRRGRLSLKGRSKSMGRPRRRRAVIRKQRAAKGRKNRMKRVKR
jgi:glycosyltransferase involved in cell wall biosynthesis